MKPEILTTAKQFAVQFINLEKEFSSVVPNPRQRALVKRLVSLERKPAEERTETDFWELEDIAGQLADVPPYKKVSYPNKDGLQPLPKPSQKVLERMAVAQADANLRGLDNLMEMVPQPISSIQVVDGYGPMMLRQAIAARLERRAKMTFWGRLLDSVKSFFRRT